MINLGLKTILQEGGEIDNRYVLIAGGTYDNEFFFENVLNKFGGLFTGRIITNDFTLDNKQVTTITIAGITNNDKLTSQGYVDSKVDSKAQEVKNYVDNHYFSKPEINVKIDGINDLIDDVADDITAVADSVTALSATVALCASTAAMMAALATKADKSEVYDKGDIDDMIEDLEDTIRTKANASNVYTKNEVNNMVNGKANAADVYTKTQVNNLVDGKANISDVYTKTDINGFLLLKANISDVYTKNEIDAALILKANAADVYTKTETNNLLTLKADTSDVYTKTQVYTKTEVDTALNLKADKATTYTKTEVDAMIGGVVPTADNVGKKYPGSINGEIFNDYTYNEASGDYAHAEGYHTTATGDASHASGNETYADQTAQTAIGQYNTKNNSNCLFVVGNGTSDQARRDAFTVYKDYGTQINNYYRYNTSNYYQSCCWLPLGHFTPFYVTGTLRISGNQNGQEVGYYNVDCIAHGFQEPDENITVFTNIRTISTVVITRNLWTCISQLSWGDASHDEIFYFTTTNASGYNNYYCGNWEALSLNPNLVSPYQHYNYRGSMIYLSDGSNNVNNVQYKPYFFNQNGSEWSWGQTSEQFDISINNLFIKSWPSYFRKIGKY